MCQIVTARLRADENGEFVIQYEVENTLDDQDLVNVSVECSSKDKIGKSFEKKKNEKEKEQLKSNVGNPPYIVRNVPIQNCWIQITSDDLCCVCSRFEKAFILHLQQAQGFFTDGESPVQYAHQMSNDGEYGDGRIFWAICAFYHIRI
ncbi:MAG: hypothetical protein EZS28_018486 [Streblomastix strix]|uniref:Coatomer gamma subunit appendage Ig-like subdomain domain-containing protein n=1 Tax=Streblomastix strix TaxID=222440 RepID=A0A5J4VTQ0_9EUKA|nr:MAG: hypothetical protein EZS28_018486 [Streblomastix strix]